MTKTMMLAAMTMVGKYFCPLLVSWSSGAALRRKTCGIPFYPNATTTSTWHCNHNEDDDDDDDEDDGDNDDQDIWGKPKKVVLRYISAAFPAFLGLLKV